MAYRLICIYESKDCEFPELRIEINKDIKSNSLAPFMRKINLDNLFSEDIKPDKKLLSLLDHLGLQKQPFRINKKILLNRDIRNLLRNNPWNYFQLNGKGSAKSIPCPLCNIINSNNKSLGNLLGGELYIDQLNSWNKKMKVRLLYFNALNSFYPNFSELPFLTRDNRLLYRNHDSEILLLNTLGFGYDKDTQTFSLDNYDTEYLNDLTNKGWKIYVINQSKSHSQIYSHREPSGIIWFSTENDQNNNFSQQLLESFLKNRNYHELDGKISLFKKEDIRKENNKIIIDNLTSTCELDDLFSGEKSLTIQETVQIRYKLNELLKATLRPYQMEGVKWLQLQRKNQHGCLLADEMGLGKTIQIIAHLCCLGNEAKHLVISPTSLIYNWENEVNRFAPSIYNRITFVSYDMLRIHLDKYINNEYDTIIIDEAQIIKNRQTQKYQAISKLKSKHKIILTGTPIENSIDDLWSHFIMLIPRTNILYKILHKRDISNNNEAYTILTGKLLKPFILRRTKKDVLFDLPEKTEKTIYIELSKKERLVYDNIHYTIQQAFKIGISGRINSIALEGLLRLHQACVSTNLLPQNLSASSLTSTKLTTAIDMIETFKSENRKVLVFSQFVGALHEMESLLKNNGIKFVSLYGDTRNREVSVANFQNDKSVTVFLISIKAGGVGLNLTSADRVLLLDDWWNPAVEDQAMSRAHRIGQNNKVLVFRFVCKNTIEEKILSLQEKKRNTIELFNGINERLSFDEIKALIE